MDKEEEEEDDDEEEDEGRKVRKKGTRLFLLVLHTTVLARFCVTNISYTSTYLGPRHYY